MITLVSLSEVDPPAVEALLDAAFGTDRLGRTAYKLRAGTRMIPHLSFGALDQGGSLVGSLQSWPVAIDTGDARAPLVLVGPVAVDPLLQRDGIGREMMHYMLRAADAAGDDALMLIGDPEYYGRFFGFDARPTGGWELPGPVDRHRLLARLTGGRTLPRVGMIVPRVAEAALR